MPGSIRAESRMVIETVTKSTTTSVTTTQQQQQQQQQTFVQMQRQQFKQQEQQVQPGLAHPGWAPAPLTVDANKVTATGTGLHQANVNQEASIIVDGSQSGQFIGPLTQCRR